MSAVVEHQQSNVIPAQTKRHTLMQKFAAKFSVEPGKLLDAMRATCFRQQSGGPEITNEHMVALLVIADQYNLNPFLKELYAYPQKGGGIMPMVGIDGWIRMINERPEFDGEEFAYGPNYKTTQVPEWIECTIYRKDRTRPTVVREFYEECKRETDPWKTAPRRMLRHRALIQCARVAFGFGGLNDVDEGERIIEGGVSVVRDDPFASVNQAIAARPAQAAIEAPQQPTVVQQTVDQDTGEIVDAQQASAPAQQVAQAAPEQQPDPDAPQITYAQLEARMRGAKTIQSLEDAAQLIQALPKEMQADASNEFGRLLAKLKKAGE